MSAKGQTVALPSRLLARYLVQLERSPILTKAATGGAAYYLSELVSTALVRLLARKTRSLKAPHGPHDRAQRVPGILTAQTQWLALKLAVYAAFIAAPLDHGLYELLARLFRGHTSRRTRIAEIVVAVGAILPIQNAVYLAALSLVHGARKTRQVVAEVQQDLIGVTKMSAVIQTLALIIAQRVLPQSAWTPFFTMAAVTVDTAINVQTKLARTTTGPLGPDGQME
ncbi:hypothetical protein BMF94_6461 [Rhodotorula taiwanensis]|uniref:Uncharacterized protein n=1 Tax=Rhodotorula taiwanensis TaxID=741276 RepID=A0A2S5B189_9BASI|nr:hypothetical protein BMF94_6461 [Rhodotorula taiwanensis]